MYFEGKRGLKRKECARSGVPWGRGVWERGGLCPTSLCLCPFLVPDWCCFVGPLRRFSWEGYFSFCLALVLQASGGLPTLRLSMIGHATSCSWLSLDPITNVTSCRGLPPAGLRGRSFNCLICLVPRHRVPLLGCCFAPPSVRNLQGHFKSILIDVPCLLLSDLVSSRQISGNSSKV